MTVEKCLNVKVLAGALTRAQADDQAEQIPRLPKPLHPAPQMVLEGAECQI